MDGLELYLFRAIVPQKKLDIRLDKVTDLYGSPSIDDIEKCGIQSASKCSGLNS